MKLTIWLVIAAPFALWTCHIAVAADKRDTAASIHVSKMSNLKVRVHGNTAVVTGAYYERGTEKGKPYEYRDRLTDV